jgi:hypothetical protein
MVLGSGGCSPIKQGATTLRSYLNLVGFTDEELVKVDPVVMNLLVARSIPSLEKVDISSYQAQRDVSPLRSIRSCPTPGGSFSGTPGHRRPAIGLLH